MDISPATEVQNRHEILTQNTWLRGLVITTCVLSLLGSLFIILVYSCCRSLRTVGKQMLVHISIMTAGLSLANLIGVLANFDQYFYGPNGEERFPMFPIRVSCDLESFFAVYFTSGAIMWTIGLSLFLYLKIVHYGTSSASLCAQWTMLIWCYVLPIVLSLWKILTMRLGYSRSPFATEGWCGEKLAGLHDRGPGGSSNVYTTFIGYDIWMYTAYILIPTLSLATHLYIRSEVSY